MTSDFITVHVSKNIVIKKSPNFKTLPDYPRTRLKVREITIIFVVADAVVPVAVVAVCQGARGG